MKDIKNKYLTLSNEQLEELEDFQQGDTVEIKCVCTVKKRDTQQAKVLEPGEEPEDPNSNPDQVMPKSFITLEILEAEVLNKTPERKRAEHLGVAKEDLRKIGRKSNSVG